MSTWFYSHAGTRSGPHSTDVMKSLSSAGTVADDTLCWRHDFGSEWKQYRSTELFVPPLVDPTQPPPLPPNAISNVYAWVFAAIPIVGALIEQFISEQLSRPSLPIVPIILAYFLTYGILAQLDSKKLSSAGVDPKRLPQTSLVLIAPLYLWKRAEFLGQPKFYFWTWIGSFLLVVALQSGL